MENIHYNNDYDDITRLKGYIDQFKTRMNQEMKQPDFEPTATQQHDGYDGVVTELNNNLQSLDIDKTEIFTSPEKTNQLLLSCLLSSDNQDNMNTDQLYHFLISSTRKPYHDPFTGDFYPEGKYEVNDVIDSRLLAEFLIKESYRLKNN